MSYIYKNGRKFGGNVRIGEDEYEELYLDIPDYQTANTDDKAIYDAVNSLGWTGVITNAVLNIKKLIVNILTLIVKSPIITREVTLSASTTSTYEIGSVTAPIVTGYSFLCWGACSSEGYVGSPYPQTPQLSTTKIWDAWHTASMPNCYIRATAIYVRS